MTTNDELSALMRSVYASQVPVIWPSRPTPFFRRVVRWIRGERWSETARAYYSTWEMMGGDL